MGHDRAGITDGIDAPDRSRPSLLVPPQFGQRRLRAHMGEGKGWYRDGAAARAQCRADGIVVGEAIDEGGEAADFLERPAPERNRRAEAGARTAKRQADHDARQYRKSVV